MKKSFEKSFYSVNQMTKSAPTLSRITAQPLPATVHPVIEMRQDITSVLKRAAQHSAADVCFVKTLPLPDLILTMTKPSHNYLAPRGGHCWGGCACRR